MRARALPLLLTLALVPSLAACDIGELGNALVRFTSPAIGSQLVEPTTEFVLRLPKSRSAVEISLDGVPLDTNSWSQNDHEARGALTGVAPGPHELSAQVTLRVSFLGIPVRVSTSIAFEMAAAPGFSVRESVEQLHVTRGDPNSALEVWDAAANVVATGTTDYQGSLIFRELAPGDGYRVVAAGPPREVSRALRVMPVAGSTPPQQFYDDQVLEPGYGYLTTRDGTRLSVFVSLPGPPEGGPYPVLVNYSGYDPSEPVGALDLGGFDLSGSCATTSRCCATRRTPPKR